MISMEFETSKHENDEIADQDSGIINDKSYKKGEKKGGTVLSSVALT